MSPYPGDNHPLTGASVVAPETFILATRDTGYRDIAAALAELVDNSVQAEATSILIAVDESRSAARSDFTVSVLDNGSGMPPDTEAVPPESVAIQVNDPTTRKTRR